MKKKETKEKTNRKIDGNKLSEWEYNFGVRRERTEEEKKWVLSFWVESGILILLGYLGNMGPYAL